MPWHRVDQRFACYTRTRTYPGSNPTHWKIQTCLQAIEELKKLKTLMISEKFNPKYRNYRNRR